MRFTTITGKIDPVWAKAFLAGSGPNQSKQPNIMKTLEAAPPRGKKVAAVAPREANTTTAGSSITTSDGKNGHALAATQVASAGLEALMRKAIAAAGCKDVAAFKRLPSEEQNAFLAQARGQARPEVSAVTGGYRQIAPVKLWRSATNRTVEKDDDYDKLRENIREHGILQPLVARPLPAGEWFIDPGWRGKVPGYFVTCRAYHAYLHSIGQPGYVHHPIWSQFQPGFFTDQEEAQANLPEFEIIIGEHRWTAALEIGLATVPILVRTMDDREAILTQLSENLRRKNLKPLDEARGYQRMRDLGMSIEDIGKELGSGDKELSKSTIYGRLKLLELPAEVQTAVESGALAASHAELISKVSNPELQQKLTKAILTPKDVYTHDGPKKEPISFREAKELAERAAKDEQKEEAWQKESAEHLAKGYKVLTLQQSAAVFNYGSLRSSYVGVGDKCDVDPKGRTWKVLVGDHAPHAIVAKSDGYSTGNKLRIVYPRKAAVKALKLAGHDFAQVPEAELKLNPNLARERAEEKRKRAEEKRFAIDAVNVEKVVAAAEAREPNADFLRLIVEALLGNAESKWIIKRRAIPLVETKGEWKQEQLTMAAFLAKCDGKTLRGLAIESLLWEWQGAESSTLKTVAGLYKVKLQTSGKQKADADEDEHDEN